MQLKLKFGETQASPRKQKAVAPHNSNFKKSDCCWLLLLILQYGDGDGGGCLSVSILHSLGLVYWQGVWRESVSVGVLVVEFRVSECCV